MRGKHIPPCTECRQNTPRLGETVCGPCQVIEATHDRFQQAVTEFRSNIDEVECEHTRQCLKALFELVGGDEL